MRTGWLLWVAAALFPAGILLAYGPPGQNEADQSHSKPAQTASSDTNAAHQIAEGDEAGNPPPYVLRPWRALRGHLHNKIVHVPIGFGMSAFLLCLLGLRRPEMQPAIRWLVLLAALGAVGAYFTGTSQAGALAGGSKDWVVDLHEKLGIATATVLWMWAASFWFRPLKRWTFIAGAVAMSLIVVTGFFGGILAHG